MRRISANYILPVNSPPIRNGILEIDDKGFINDIINPGKTFKETRNLEFYNGILTPGFIDTYSRLEFSYLEKGSSPYLSPEEIYNRIQESSASISFEKKQKILGNADFFKNASGIAAALDHCFFNDTFPVKKNSQVYYYTLIETISKLESADDYSKNAVEILDQMTELHSIHGNLNPVALFSVNSKFHGDLIRKNPVPSVYSVSLFNATEKNTGENLSNFNHETVDSFLKDWLRHDNNVLFIRDFYDKSSGNAISMPGNYKNIYYTLHYPLGQNIPSLNFLSEKTGFITLGTGCRPAGNGSSILDEIKELQRLYSSVNFNELLSWATINSARALGMEDSYGTLEKNKNPGINLIKPFDFTNWRLKEESTVKKLA
jgi:hypothetical protein